MLVKVGVKRKAIIKAPDPQRITLIIEKESSGNSISTT